ncbi:hypothetical protein M407DRAFT_4052 [Tulasnella calospora MUT 4182]|uniref:DUF6534 domain-containing protein n=1 Tax=Tulasnella calospora MUT 4182 TaxID=1051891 RepID=A0A0C3MI01_9AGAM|nr:hypothetical protein M407DRAFT_4052 [Tulasnella calospora MUT 4182]
MPNPTTGMGPDAIAYAVELVKADPGGQLGPWFLALIGLTFMMLRHLGPFRPFTDLAIASITFWKLGGHNGGTYSSNTNDVLQRLRKLTIEAAIPPAICALLNMIFYLTMGAKNRIFVVFAIMIPQFYMWSMLLTLNSRLTIRQTFNSPNDEEAVSTHFEFANHPNRKRGQTLIGPSTFFSFHKDTRRTTVVFATMTGTTYAPNASMGLVDECVGGGRGDDRRGGDLDSKVYDDSLAEQSRGEVQVDLDRWDWVVKGRGS